MTDKQSSDSESPAESIEDEDVVMKDSDDIDTPKSQDDTDNELSRENKSNDNNDDVETSDSDYDHSLKLTKSHEPTTEFSGNEDQETQTDFKMPIVKNISTKTLKLMRTIKIQMINT